jgi:hypothetical protein
LLFFSAPFSPVFSSFLCSFFLLFSTLFLCSFFLCFPPPHLGH